MKKKTPSNLVQLLRLVLPKKRKKTSRFLVVRRRKQNEIMNIKKHQAKILTLSFAIRKDEQTFDKIKKEL
jgi:hypothetical protein